MNKIYTTIQKQADEYLRKGINKDFVVHTCGVTKAMKLILKKEKADPTVLIPAAILHDVGWAMVPKKLQRTNDKKKRLTAMHLHIKYAPEIIRKILNEISYPKKKINEIVEIVKAHKFKNPRKLSKRLLVDADQLADAFKKQFYCDAKEYNLLPKKNYEFRMKDNKFYTNTAKDLFLEEMNKRAKEIKK